MQRKVEMEVPQLPPRSSLPPIKKDPEKQTIIRRNSTEQAIQCMAPAKRRQSITCRSEVLCQRTNLAAQTREETLSSMRREFAEALQRKRNQGERAFHSRVEPKAKAAPRQDILFAQHWFRTCVLAASVANMAEDLKLSRMPQEERMRYMAQRRASNGRMGGQMMQQAVFLNQILEDEESCHKIGLITAVVKNRIRIMEARKQTRTIFDCLSSWKVAGPCFMITKKIYCRIVLLQRWWRTTSRHLREVRDHVSRRWERLERTQLVQELTRASGPPPSRLKGAPAPPKMTLEDRIESEKIEDSVRLRFIENELRIRRYRLLTQIFMWEEEVVRWRTQQREWNSTREAHLALGKEAPARRIFHWPPVPPSYLPKLHAVSEAQGLPCTESCPGRQGDEDILNMLRAARRKQATFTHMPRKGSVPEFRAGSRRASAAAGRQGSTPTGSSMFGDAEDEDLQRWGVNASSMPGLSGEVGGEATAKASAPEVCAPC